MDEPFTCGGTHEPTDDCEQVSLHKVALRVNPLFGVGDRSFVKASGRPRRVIAGRLVQWVVCAKFAHIHGP